MLLVHHLLGVEWVGSEKNALHSAWAHPMVSIVVKAGQIARRNRLFTFEDNYWL